MVQCKKRASGGDFTKEKNKVGKRKAFKANATNTQVHFRRIHVPDNVSARVGNDADEARNHRNKNLAQLLSKLKHYSGNERRSAVGGLRNLYEMHPDKLSASALLRALSPLLVDEDKGVRGSLTAAFRSLFKRKEQLVVFLPAFCGYVLAALTHPMPPIRLDGVGFLAICLELCPQQLLSVREQLKHALLGVLDDRTRTDALGIGSRSHNKSHRSLLRCVRGVLEVAPPDVVAHVTPTSNEDLALLHTHVDVITDTMTSSSSSTSTSERLASVIIECFVEYCDGGNAFASEMLECIRCLLLLLPSSSSSSSSVVADDLDTHVLTRFPITFRNASAIAQQLNLALCALACHNTNDVALFERVITFLRVTSPLAPVPCASLLQRLLPRVSSDDVASFAVVFASLPERRDCLPLLTAVVEAFPNAASSWLQKLPEDARAHVEDDVELVVLGNVARKYPELFPDVSALFERDYVVRAPDVVQQRLASLLFYVPNLDTTLLPLVSNLGDRFIDVVALRRRDVDIAVYVSFFLTVVMRNDANDVGVTRACESALARVRGEFSIVELLLPAVRAQLGVLEHQNQQQLRRRLLRLCQFCIVHGASDVTFVAAHLWMLWNDPERDVTASTQCIDLLRASRTVMSDVLDVICNQLALLDMAALVDLFGVDVLRPLLIGNRDMVLKIYRKASQLADAHTLELLRSELVITFGADVFTAL